MVSIGEILLIILIVTLVVVAVIVAFWVKGNFRRNSGDSCSHNFNCTNGACGRETAADDAPLICCPSGALDNFGGFDYCTEMPNGSTCWSDAMCAGGDCSGNLGGFQKGTCVGNNPTGATCTSNSDCANDACGRQTADDNAPLICCPSGETDLFGGFDYCTEMPNGSVCWSDSMCANGLCQGNNGGFNKGICQGNASTGATCTENSDCANDACGRQTAATGAPLICCPSGQTDLFGGFDYCTEMPDGSVCWSNDMCESGICVGGSITSRGICNATLLPTGATCTSNSDCENDACGRQTAATGAPLICCPSGGLDLYDFLDYCTEMPNGSVCLSDAMCASNNCINNTCSDLYPVGATCTSNSDCQNDACGRQTAADGAQLICCPSGQIVTYAFFDYCTEMPSGSVCWLDSMCSSDDCSGNVGGLEKGTCT